MQHISEIVKTIAKKSFTALLKVVLIALIGVVVNLILVIVQWDLITAMWTSKVTLSTNIKAITVLVGAFLFPIVFFVLGKKLALQGVLASLFHEKKSDMVYFLVNKIYEKKPELFDENIKLPATLQQITDSASTIFHSLPSPVIKVLSHFVEKTGFYQLMLEELNQLKKESEGKVGAQRVEVLANNITMKIPEDLLKPEYLFIGIAFGTNVALFFIKATNSVPSW